MECQLFERARRHGARTALVDERGSWTYRELVEASARVATFLLGGRSALGGARVCFLVPPGREHVAVQWGIWRAGGVAVPLAVSHPEAELAFVLDDAEPERVVASEDLADRLAPAAADRGVPLDGPEGALAAPLRSDLPVLAAADAAMMLYTSGTTGRPKGVVVSHGNLEAQVRTLVDAWGWIPDDRTLLVLPLHHTHGIVNVLTCALWTGAACEILPRFDAARTWERLGSGELTVFMAVPTIYRRLIDAWQREPEDVRAAWSEGARALRLMVSGSAALPVETLERWEAITGHRLLERYGMTEIGMALSNPLDGERRPGHVGGPLPGVQVRLRDEAGEPPPAGEPGEIQVRGEGVFRTYWRRPRETADAFTPDGWFRTGDIARIDDGSYRILGRESVDIVKTGGEKVSALEVEEAIREHPAVSDCAVVGVRDPEWGERLCVALVMEDGRSLDIDGLREWLRPRLAPWKIPSRARAIEALPRNALGKVLKPEVAALFTPNLEEPTGS